MLAMLIAGIIPPAPVITLPHQEITLLAREIILPEVTFPPRPETTLLAETTPATEIIHHLLQTDLQTGWYTFSLNKDIVLIYRLGHNPILIQQTQQPELLCQKKKKIARNHCALLFTTKGPT